MDYDSSALPTELSSHITLVMSFNIYLFLFFVENVRCRLSAQLKSEGRCREQFDERFMVALVRVLFKIRHLYFRCRIMSYDG